MKLLVGLCFMLVLALPFVLWMKRKMNVTLLVFYGGSCLFILGGLQNLSIEQIIIVISGFAIAAGIEFAVRCEFKWAITTTLLLLFLAYSWYYMAEQGAFA